MYNRQFSLTLYRQFPDRVILLILKSYTFRSDLRFTIFTIRRCYILLHFVLLRKVHF